MRSGAHVDVRSHLQRGHHPPLESKETHRRKEEAALPAAPWSPPKAPLRASRASVGGRSAAVPASEREPPASGSEERAPGSAFFPRRGRRSEPGSGAFSGPSRSFGSATRRSSNRRGGGCSPSTLFWSHGLDRL